MSWQEPQWAAVKRYAEAQIETLRSQLETQQPECMTATIRGRIAALRLLLEQFAPPAEPDPKRKIEPDLPQY